MKKTKRFSLTLLSLVAIFALVLLSDFHLATAATGSRSLPSEAATALAPTPSGTTERVSVSSAGAQADAISWGGSISADGRYVAFCSGANNLVPDDTNNSPDIFVRDRMAGTTERVSVASDET